MPDGPAAAYDVLDELAAAGDLADWSLFLGWVVGRPDWTSKIGHGRALSVLGGYGSIDAMASGAIRYLPARLSQVPRLLSDTITPEVVVVRAKPAGHGFKLSGSIGWSQSAIQHARRVVVEVDESVPEMDTPVLPSRELFTVPSMTPAYVPPRPTLDDIDRCIGERVVELIPKGATIQHGPGTISEAFLAAIDAPVKVWSGVVSDALVDLVNRGLLVGQATAAYLWGGSKLHELAAQGLVRLRGIEETHHAGLLAAIDRFVSVNTALEVGLDGSVNVEQVGNRMIAGIGGHADFCAAGSASSGGLSIIALRSSRKGRSTIVSIAQPTSTPRSDVDIVVTEHGIADLRGLDDVSRANVLLEICEPALRVGLERAIVDRAGESPAL